MTGDIAAAISFTHKFRPATASQVARLITHKVIGTLRKERVAMVGIGFRNPTGTDLEQVSKTGDGQMQGFIGLDPAGGE